MGDDIAVEFCSMDPWLSKNASSTKIHFATGSADRHEPLCEFIKGSFQNWQAEQSKRNFGRQYILSLIYLSPGRWLFAGIYGVNGVMGRHRKSGGSGVRYNTTPLPVMQGYVGRAIIGFDKKFRQSYVLAENHLSDMCLDEVSPSRYEFERFPGYENVRINYEELCLLVGICNPEWRSALSSVKGVYLISDTNTGRLYVGSAYGDEAIWQRWTCYVENKHGGNVALKEILDARGPGYWSGFIFSILEVRSMVTGDDAILRRERHWKNVLLSREHGYNKN